MSNTKYEQIITVAYTANIEGHNNSLMANINFFLFYFIFYTLLFGIYIVYEEQIKNVFVYETLKDGGGFKKLKKTKYSRFGAFNNSTSDRVANGRYTEQ